MNEIDSESERERERELSSMESRKSSIKYKRIKLANVDVFAEFDLFNFSIIVPRNLKSARRNRAARQVYLINKR